MKKQLAALAAVAAIGVGTTAATSGASSVPAGSRIVHVTDSTHTVTLVLTRGERLYVTRSQVRVTRPNGSVVIVGLTGFRHMSVSKAQ